MSLAPKYERPAAPVPRPSLNCRRRAAPPADRDREAPSNLSWQRFFADPRLRQLIELSLANNRDLRVAVLNIEQARAAVPASARRRAPTVSAIVSGSRAAAGDDRRSRPSTRPASACRPTSSTCSAACATCSEAALSQFLATEEARKTAQISLVVVGRQHLPDDAGRRRAAGHHPADAEDPRGVDRLTGCASTTASCRSWNCASRARWSKGRGPARAIPAPARPGREPAACWWASRCRQPAAGHRPGQHRTARRAGRHAVRPAERPPGHPRGRAAADRRQRQHRRGARELLPAHLADRSRRHRQHASSRACSRAAPSAGPSRRRWCCRSSTAAAIAPASTPPRRPRHRRGPVREVDPDRVPRSGGRAGRPGDLRRAAARPAAQADAEAGPLRLADMRYRAAPPATSTCSTPSARCSRRSSAAVQAELQRCRTR